MNLLSQAPKFREGRTPLPDFVRTNKILSQYSEITARDRSAKAVVLIDHLPTDRNMPRLVLDTCM